MSLPCKKEFYSSLTIEDITDADYKHKKRVWEDFSIKNLGEYHDLYVGRSVQNFRSKYTDCKLEHAYFLSAPVLAWWMCPK